MNQTKTTRFTLTLSGTEVLEMLNAYLTAKGGKQIPAGATPVITTWSDGIAVDVSITQVQ
jgi:hypothetical protein